MDSRGTTLMTVASPQLSDMPAPDDEFLTASLEGPAIPPAGRIQLYSSDEWEQFIREYVTGLPGEYIQIKRFGGAGDRGADIAAFKTTLGLEGSWDCFQGKHYAKALNYATAAPEILKIICGVLDGAYCSPDSYHFMAPKGCGTQLNVLLSSPLKLKEKFLQQLTPENALVKHLSPERITPLLETARQFDFSIFKSVEILDALEVHAQTRYHAARFGTALKPRPADQIPPAEIDPVAETRYVSQLVAAYCERHPNEDIDSQSVASNPKVGGNFRRQRRDFYKAESLRMYARDSVPPGTFNLLQEDIHSGVIDTAEDDSLDGMQRLRAVLALVGQLDLNRHRLITRSDIDDRKGICHQLVNADRLSWIDVK